uniref:Myosin motor domain-containing protein n=1 Tax=Aplanochytrium stocchinoi TaxID=215587 RepID=A0A6S8B7P3_9STRA
MDMTELHFTHEPAILHNLKTRAAKKLPYTFIGSVLVSINPLQKVPEPPDYEYHPHPKTIAERAFKKMEFARNQILYEKDIYQAAGADVSKAITKAIEDYGPINQSILISGESGSGKTESAKRVLIHLVDREEYDEYTLDARPELYEFQEKLIGSDPILESFGNARTQRNPNSSRFGKFLKLFYGANDEYPEDLILCGAQITTYLHERSRVTYQEEAERNFRVFYQMMVAPSAAFHSELGLMQADYTFNYLGNKKFSKADMDKAGYIELRTSLHMAQLNVKTIEIFQVVAAVLHIGNIEFSKKGTTEGEVVDLVQYRERESERAETPKQDEPEDESSVEWYSPLDVAARLLGVDKMVLSEILCQRIVVGGGEKIVKRRDMKSAVRTRDAIAKFIYSLLFDWIVQQLNLNMKAASYSEDDLKVCSIGVLDVFGFEQFDKNGFEQVLINYANEILLTLFTKEILIGESEIYKQEGLVLQEGDIPRVAGTQMQGNSCIELFIGRVMPGNRRMQPGLFTILDSQGRVPNPSDKKFLAEIQKNLKTSRGFILPHPSMMESQFIIRHYAANVTYTIGSFLEKNDDNLPAEIETLFCKSSHRIVSKFPELVTGIATRGKVKRKKKGASTKSKTSVAKKFTHQIDSLTETLESTACSYIRCIKPNIKLFNPQYSEELPTYGPPALQKTRKKKSMKQNKKISLISSLVKKPKDDRYFDEEYVSQQLKNLGVFDAVSVLKSGLPTRIPYPSIIKNFADIIQMDSIPFFKNRKEQFKDKFFVSALMWAFRVPRSAYRLGHTRIFFGSGQLDIVKDVLKSASMWNSLPNSRERDKILDRFRYFYARFLWRDAFIKTVAQNHFLRALKQRRSAVKIQAFVRGYFVRQEISHKLALERKATTIQSLWRMYLAKKVLARLKEEKVAREAAEVIKELGNIMERSMEGIDDADDSDDESDDEYDYDKDDIPPSPPPHTPSFSAIAPRLEKFFYETHENQRRSQDRVVKGSLFDDNRIRHASDEDWFDIETLLLGIEFDEDEDLPGKLNEVNVPTTFDGSDFVDRVNQRDAIIKEHTLDDLEEGTLEENINDEEDDDNKEQKNKKKQKRKSGKGKTLFKKATNAINKTLPRRRFSKRSKYFDFNV